MYRGYARATGADLSEVRLPLSEHPSLGAFFVRRLKEGARPIERDPSLFVSPVDGTVQSLSPLERGTLLQAKGKPYALRELLGGHEDPALEGGFSWTIYLSPRDYHRIHAPLGGKVLGYSYLPGEFWPVNPISVRNKEALFCVNERLITWMDTPAGLCAVVAVGATCVSRIHAAYDDLVTHTGQPAKIHRYEQAIPMEKGGELGMFEMGSTVILLFAAGRVSWDDWLRPEAAVRMGRRIGEVT